MENIIPFPSKGKKTNDIPDTVPKTTEEYLKIIKKHLSMEDYEYILCGILDKDYYDVLSCNHQKIINFYFLIESLQCQKDQE